NDIQANGVKRADHLPTTEERISRFQERYRQHDFLFREFISLTNLVDDREMLQVPKNQSLVRWLVRQDILPEETGHLLSAIGNTVERMPVEQTQDLLLPEKADVLFCGGYMNAQDFQAAQKQMEASPDLDDATLLKEYMVSDRTLQIMEVLLEKLSGLLQTGKKE